MINFVSKSKKLFINSIVSTDTYCNEHSNFAIEFIFVIEFFFIH